MRACDVVQIARRRAGLSQPQLAARLGKPQSTVARWEAGLSEPSFAAVTEAVAACGLELHMGLLTADGSYAALIADQLALSPRERVASLVYADPECTLALLDEVARRPERFVVVGALAEVLVGSPVPPPPGRGVEVVAASADEAALRAWAAQAEQETGARLQLVAAPPGTGGYGDLARDATAINLAGGQLMVAHPRDLLRSADASRDPDARVSVSALRALLDALRRP